MELFELKKHFVIIIIVLFTFSCSNNPLNTSNQNEDEESEQKVEYYTDDNLDFRQTTWGMSREQVINIEETEPVFMSEKKIDYEAKMMGMDSKIGYTFNNNELVRTSFFPLSKHQNKNDYIEIYNQIQKNLKQKYGKTVIDTVQHKDPTIEIRPEDYGNAACRGDLLFATQWDLPRSDVQLLLRGEDGECMISVIYISEEGFRQMLKNR